MEPITDFYERLDVASRRFVCVFVCVCVYVYVCVCVCMSLFASSSCFSQGAGPPGDVCAVALPRLCQRRSTRLRAHQIEVRPHHMLLLGAYA
jgi:hypothetical protein